MKNLHLFSVATGVISGVLLLFVWSVGMQFFFPAQTVITSSASQQGAGSGPNLARMATRLGITQAALQKELDSGKTMQQIAAEYGVTFGGGRRSGSGSTATGSNVTQRAGSGASFRSRNSSATSLTQ